MMTFDDVFKQLHTIDRAAATLLEAAGFHPDEGLSGTVRPLRDPAQDIFLRELTENMLESLVMLHEELAYLESPVSLEYRIDSQKFFSRNPKKIADYHHHIKRRKGR